MKTAELSDGWHEGWKLSIKELRGCVGGAEVKGLEAKKIIDLTYLQVLWIKAKMYNGLRLAKKAYQPPDRLVWCRDRILPSLVY